MSEMYIFLFNNSKVLQQCKQRKDCCDSDAIPVVHGIEFELTPTLTLVSRSIAHYHAAALMPRHHW